MSRRILAAGAAKITLLAGDFLHAEGHRRSNAYITLKIQGSLQPAFLLSLKRVYLRNKFKVVAIMSIIRDLPDIEIGYSPLRLLRLTGLGVLMTAASAAVAFNWYHGKNVSMYATVISYFGVLFFGLATCKFAWLLVSSRKPVVFIGPSGIRDTRISEETIDWTSVEKISIWQYSRQKSVVLKVIPLVADSLARTGLKRLLSSTNKMFGVDGLIINSAGLTMNSDALFEACEQHRDASLSARRANRAPLYQNEGETELSAVSREAFVGLADFKLPWATILILIVLIVIFILENVFAVMPNVRSEPSLTTLFALGALSSKAILSDGQWYRLFTAPLMHASGAHITGNGVALLLGGWFLERVVGRLWFFALFVIGALGGSLMSLAFISPNTVSVGASGALMGLFAASCVISFRLPSGDPRRVRMLINSARILIPSLLPTLSATNSPIDYGAHFGGAISGVAAGALLLKFWPQTECLPQLRKTAAAIAIGGPILAAAGTCMVIVDYPAYLEAASQSQPSTTRRENPSPLSRPNASSQSASSAQESQSNILLDHGPGRVACDFQWNKSLGKSSDSYPDFLRTCMKK